MSIFHRKDWLPPGFTALGHLAKINAHAAQHLLVPLPVFEAMEEEREASRPANRARPPNEVADESSVPADKPAGLVAGESEKPTRTRRGANARGIQVFGPEAIEKAFRDLDGIDRQQQERSVPLLATTRANDGYRLLPKIAPALKRLRATQAEFENLREPITKLMVDLALAKAMPPRDFHIRPILLAGGPGIGKTHFALQLAKALGVPMQKWSASNAQASFQLAGGASDWRHAKPGLIFDLLSQGQSAAPVFVLDEVDKLSLNGSYPVMPVLLELLEAGTARAFRDEYFRMEFDASRIIFVLTANELDRVPAPLLSRVEVFDVATPDAAQRLRIIQSEVERLRLKTRKRVELDQVAAEALAERVDIDLRQTLRLVIDAFALSLTERRDVVTPKLPVRRHRPAIGFMA